jgi:iron complex transport system permease protein
MTHRHWHPRTILILLAVTLVAAMIVTLELGSTRLSWHRILATFLGQGDWLDSLLIFQLRLPRLIMCVLIGSSLAVSGVILQGVSRNDLASPDTVGVNAGSGLGVMLFLVYCPTATTRGSLVMPLVAIAGSLLMTAIVFALAYRRGSVLPSRLLLVGIALGFGAHAAMLLLSMRMGFTTYNSVLSWMAGTLGASDWSSIAFLLPWPLLLIPLVLSRSRILDVFTLGEGIAASLGVNVERQRLLLASLATALTSVCVAIGGHIGFLGLAGPHLARRLVGPRHVVLIPAAALTGATLLVVADGLARHLFAPAELPAGVLVGILGGTYFVYLLATSKG